MATFKVEVPVYGTRTYWVEAEDGAEVDAIFSGGGDFEYNTQVDFADDHTNLAPEEYVIVSEYDAEGNEVR